MSVSGKKEFDVKQILRLRWRWFSHSSQGSAGGGGGGGSGVGGYIQQDGLDHRGTPVQGRLKSHSRERGFGGLRKTNSPVHSVMPPTPGPTQVYVRTGHQSWHHLPNTIQGLQVNEESPKSISSPSSARKEETNSGQKDVNSSTEEPAEVDARDRPLCCLRGSPGDSSIPSSTACIAVLEGPMYAVGGHDGWSYLNTVERWDPQARQWNYVASMSTPRSTMGVTALNGKLFAVGGRDGSSCLRSMECFDPHTNKWSMCAPMSKRRGGVGVATYNNFLYAVGGHDAPASNHCSRLSDCVERYDPKTDTWTTAVRSGRI
ncbi:kelch-like protein 4 [Nematolebias whitei]|uniref:kelch-like protein 4 n=1 Tax=Nematolebias whitei TaxID=451745 RepID=UPI001899BB40|nr:kelch-like protein 4 [Nematolebias whitei]